MLRGDRTPGAQDGFIYIGFLIALLIFGVGLAHIGPLLSDQAQREREDELLAIGDEVVSAIRSYHDATPGAGKQLPVHWRDLLEDRRSLQLRRHLRRIPRDPMTNATDWEIVRDVSGGMLGIRSRSDRKPFRTTVAVSSVSGQGTPLRYSDWSFIYAPLAAR
jgi:hypothetical protein